MNMKKIFYLTLGATLLFLASCHKVDNWDEPGSRLYGNVIDSYTGTNLVMDNNDWQIRIWDKTWEVMNPGAVAQYQSLAVMRDGVYNDTKLFAGTYNMLPYDGAFWPADTVKGVVLGKETQQDFTVIPYLQIVNATATLGGTLAAPTLTFTCNLKAPLLQKLVNQVMTALPNLYYVRPFLSLTTFCGNSNYISIPEYTNVRSTSIPAGPVININRSWAAELAAQVPPLTGDLSPTYTMVVPVKPGYSYYVRIAANVNALSRRYNYSPIVKIDVPSAKK